MVQTKRLQFKRKWRLNVQAPATAGNLSLYVADRKVTLIRTIIDLQLMPNTTPGYDLDYDAVMSIYPRGQQVVSDPASTHGDLQEIPEQELGRWARTAKMRAGADDPDINYPSIEVREDIKGQRKMNEADQLVWRHKASTASAFEVHGTITMFFKES